MQAGRAEPITLQTGPGARDARGGSPGLLTVSGGNQAVGVHVGVTGSRSRQEWQAPATAAPEIRRTASASGAETADGDGRDCEATGTGSAGSNRRGGGRAPSNVQLRGADSRRDGAAVHSARAPVLLLRRGPADAPLRIARSVRAAPHHPAVHATPPHPPPPHGTVPPGPTRAWQHDRPDGPPSQATHAMPDEPSRSMRASQCMLASPPPPRSRSSRKRRSTNAERRSLRLNLGLYGASYHDRPLSWLHGVQPASHIAAILPWPPESVLPPALLLPHQFLSLASSSTTSYDSSVERLCRVRLSHPKLCCQSLSPVRLSAGVPPRAEAPVLCFDSACNHARVVTYRRPCRASAPRPEPSPVG